MGSECCSGGIGIWYHSLAGNFLQTEEFILLAVFSGEGWLYLMLEADVDPLQTFSSHCRLKHLYNKYF